MKFKTIIYLSLILIMFCGCSDFLEEKPKEFLSPKNFPSNRADVDLLLNGAVGLQRVQQMYDRAFPFLAGVSGDDMNYRSTTAVRLSLDNYTYLSTNSFIENVWQIGYQIIGETNRLIESVPKLNMNSNDEERYLAAARFLRGLYYFHLVRLFGDNLILLDKPITDFEGDWNDQKASIESVYELIKSDVDYAAGMLNETETRLPKESWGVSGLPTYIAAKTLQSKVYLTMAGHPLNQTDKMSMARDAAKAVMDIVYDPSVADVSSLFLIENKESDEFIYSIQNYLPDYGSMMTIQTIPKGWAFFCGNWDYLNKYYQGSDLRREAFSILEQEDWFKNTKDFDKFPYIRKWADIGRDKISDFGKRTNNNFPVFRVAEVYLMFAEAEIETNGATQDAHDALNAIRTRSGLSALSGLSSDALLDSVKYERARELAYECKRRFDLHRWGEMEAVLSADEKASVGFDIAEKEYFPVPERDVILNPDLGEE